MISTPYIYIITYCQKKSFVAIIIALYICTRSTY